jgi:hypothetical protein
MIIENNKRTEHLFCATQDHAASRLAPTRCHFTRLRIFWLDTKQTPGYKQCCFYFWHMETQVFTAETVHSINTTKHHILSFVQFIYTYKNVVFPEALRCGKNIPMFFV